MTRTHATGSQFRVLVYVFFPSGGISRYSSEMFSAIAKRLPESAVGLLAPPEYPWQRGAATERLMSISSHHAVVRRARFLLAQIINPLLLIRAARRRRAEWIHFANVNTVFYPLWGWLLRRSASRVAISVHDVSRTKGIINLRWELRQLRRIYRDADALFVHSHEQSAHLVAFADVPRDRIHIVPHGPLPFDGHGTPAPRPRLRCCVVVEGFTGPRKRWPRAFGAAGPLDEAPEEVECARRASGCARGLSGRRVLVRAIRVDGHRDEIELEPSMPFQ